MSDFDNEEVIEKINEADVEEIPPTPVAPNPDMGAAAGGRPYSEYESADDDKFSSSNSSSYSTLDEDEVTSRTLGIIGMVCGIMSLLCCCIPWLGFILSVGAIVLGIISMKKGERGKGMAIAGLVCGIIGVIIAAGILIFSGFVASLSKLFDGTGFDINEFI